MFTHADQVAGGKARHATKVKSTIKQAESFQRIADEAAPLLLKDLKECGDKEVRTKLASAILSLARTWDLAVNRAKLLKGQAWPVSAKAPPATKSKPAPESITPLDQSVA